MQLRLLLLMIAVMTIAASCGGDDEPTDTCSTTGMTYTDDIATIVNTNCATSGCHSESAVSNGTFPLTNYTEVSVLFRGANAFLSINHEGSVEPMPRGGEKMDQCLIDKIQAWADQDFAE